jgi:mannose-6-phosphate isomerase-like protein (cupin superfamily)
MISKNATRLLGGARRETMTEAAGNGVVRFNLRDARTQPLRWDRGMMHKLVDPDVGAANVDLHINVINVGSGSGPYHYHAKSENVYVVLEGTVWAVVDGVKHVLGKDDVVFIPPGVKHCAGNGGDAPCRVIEIYAPPGPDFHIVDDEPEALEAWAK